LGNLDKQWFRDLAMDTWIQSLNPTTQRTAQYIFNQFKEEMILDPVQMAFESRRSQDTRLIESALSRFYFRCLARGLSEASAWQYVIILRGFFKGNRVPLPTGIKKPAAPVPLQTLFD